MALAKETNLSYYDCSDEWFLNCTSQVFCSYLEARELFSKEYSLLYMILPTLLAI